MGRPGISVLPLLKHLRISQAADITHICKEYHFALSTCVKKVFLYFMEEKYTE